MGIATNRLQVPGHCPATLHEHSSMQIYSAGNEQRRTFNDRLTDLCQIQITALLGIRIMSF